MGTTNSSDENIVRADGGDREFNFTGKDFQFLFCRNVVIYFDRDTQRKLFDRYADILVPEGHIFIGHSESLHKVSERFRLIGREIYRKMG